MYTAQCYGWKYCEIICWRLAVSLTFAALITSHGTSSTAMSSSKFGSRWDSAKLCRTAAATIVSRVFRRNVRIPECRQGNRLLSIPKLNISQLCTTSVYGQYCSTLLPSFVGRRIGVIRIPSISPSLRRSSNRAVFKYTWIVSWYWPMCHNVIDDGLAITYCFNVWYIDGVKLFSIDKFHCTVSVWTHYSNVGTINCSNYTFIEQFHKTFSSSQTSLFGMK